MENQKEVISNEQRFNINDAITAKMKEGLEKNELPWIPNESGYCNTKAVKNAITGYEFTGANQLIAKMYLQERGVPNDNILTYKQANEKKTTIRGGEKGFSLPFYDREKNKSVFTRYFAESQTTNKELLPYQPVTPVKTNAFEQTTGDAQDYLTNYLTCVKENRPFKASKEVVAEFKENFAKELEKSSYQIFKLGNAASKAIWEKEQNKPIDRQKGVEKLETLKNNLAQKQSKQPVAEIER